MVKCGVQMDAILHPQGQLNGIMVVSFLSKSSGHKQEGEHKNNRQSSFHNVPQPDSFGKYNVQNPPAFREGLAFPSTNHKMDCETGIIP